MPCALAAVAFFFPRVVILLLVLFGTYMGDAYKTAIWPVLGFFLMPYTTLAYAWAWHTGQGSVSGFGLFVVILAVLVDLSTHGGSGKATRTVYIKKKR
jgi:hypothetical protein